MFHGQGLTTLEAFKSLPAVVFPYHTLWPKLASPKRFPLAKVVTRLSLLIFRVNRTVDRWDAVTLGDMKYLNHGLLIVPTVCS